MKPKTITQILEDWLENANSTSMMGVTIDDERTDADREKQYQDYLAEALAQIQQLIEECAPQRKSMEPAYDTGEKEVQ